MLKDCLSADELKNILSLTEEGTTDLISTRSKAYQQLDIDLDELSVLELLKVLEDNPGLLRRPILMDPKRMQIGFNEAEIRCFLPREVRKMELRNAQMMSGF
jgi:regulatory protein spx